MKLIEELMQEENVAWEQLFESKIIEAYSVKYETVMHSMAVWNSEKVSGCKSISIKSALS